MNKILIKCLLMLLCLSAFPVLAQKKAESAPKNNLEQELNNFRNWVNTKTKKLDSVAAEEWPQIHSDFNRFTNKLDKGVDSLSARSQEEYKTLKLRYQTWEEQNEARQAAGFDEKKLRYWENLLLDEFAPIRKIKAKELLPAYQTLIQETRSAHRDWEDRDWDYASEIYRRLTEHKISLQKQLSTSEALKISGLQVEFRTLQKARTTSNMIEGLRKEKEE